MIRAILAAMGPLSVAIAFLWLALLSRRLGSVTPTPPYYIGLLVSSALVGTSAIARFVHTLLQMPGQNTAVESLLFTGLPALGITIAVSFAWRYWSWLLAERA